MATLLSTVYMRGPLDENGKEVYPEENYAGTVARFVTIMFIRSRADVGDDITVSHTLSRTGLRFVRPKCLLFWEITLIKINKGKGFAFVHS